MHFSYFQSDIHRKEYWPKLSEIMTLYGLGPYSKGREDMYHTVTPLSGGSTPACAEGAAAPFFAAAMGRPIGAPCDTKS